MLAFALVASRFSDLPCSTHFSTLCAVACVRWQVACQASRKPGIDQLTSFFRKFASVIHMYQRLAIIDLLRCVKHNHLRSHLPSLCLVRTSNTWHIPSRFCAVRILLGLLTKSLGDCLINYRFCILPTLPCLKSAQDSARPWQVLCFTLLTRVLHSRCGTYQTRFAVNMS